MGVNDCSINELLDSFYYADLLHLPLSIAKINTNILAILLGKDLTTKFGKNMPCKVIISPTEVPQFTKSYASDEYNPDNFWEIATPL
jgi:hypothetical protein